MSEMREGGREGSEQGGAGGRKERDKERDGGREGWQGGRAWHELKRGRLPLGIIVDIIFHRTPSAGLL